MTRAGDAGGLSSGNSRDNDTVVPVRTSAAACCRLAGVIRLVAPNWSSFPQRPQFDSLVIHSSNCGFVTLLWFAGDSVWGAACRVGCPVVWPPDAIQPLTASITARPTIVFLVVMSHSYRGPVQNHLRR